MNKLVVKAVLWEETDRGRELPTYFSTTHSIRQQYTQGPSSPTTAGNLSPRSGSFLRTPRQWKAAFLQEHFNVHEYPNYNSTSSQSLVRAEGRIWSNFICWILWRCFFVGSQLNTWGGIGGYFIIQTENRGSWGVGRRRWCSQLTHGLGVGCELGVRVIATCALPILSSVDIPNLNFSVDVMK